MSAAASGNNGGQGAGAPSPDDPNALVEDIDRTRAELGDTVQALLAKADVKARAQQRAAEVSTQAKDKLQTVKQELSDRASQLTGKAEQSAPEPVQRGAQQVAKTVSQYRVPFAAAAGAVLVAVAGWLAVRRRRH
jgi:LPXTG-motif cell wall-anchored protein